MSMHFTYQALEGEWLSERPALDPSFDRAGLLAVHLVSFEGDL